MKKRIIATVLIMCTMLFAGCGAKTMYALEPSETEETVEETEVMETESVEETETEEEVSMKSTEMQEDITDADYIAMAKDCEKEFKILNGEEYDCEIAIDLRGCIYVYEFPEEEVTAEECSLLFEYEDAKIINTSEGKKVEIPISLCSTENKYFIGIADFIPNRSVQEDRLIIDHISYYYQDYRDDLNYELLKEQNSERKFAIIRDYNPENKSVEMCYVTAIDCDTYADYKIETEEWISMPLKEESKIVAWSWGYTCAAFINEEVFDEAVEDMIDKGYFFATIYEGDGYIQGIVQVFNP